MQLQVIVSNSGPTTYHGRMFSGKKGNSIILGMTEKCLLSLISKTEKNFLCT